MLMRAGGTHPSIEEAAAAAAAAAAANAAAPGGRPRRTPVEAGRMG